MLEKTASFGFACNGCMTYVDSDGEHITISHEIEFLEAVALQSPLKLIVKGVSDVQSSQPVDSASNESTRQRMVEIKEAAKIGGVQAQQVAAPPCPAVDSVWTSRARRSSPVASLD